MTKGNGCKPKEGRFKQDIRKRYFDGEDDETLEQAAQTSDSYLIPVNFQGQVTQG